jgi:hypothetical protein
LLLIRENDNDIRAMANAYGRTSMKILLYFDWVGSRKELREHDKRMQKAATEVGVEYMGIHGSMNQKWNFCWLFDARSYDHFMEMTAKVPRPLQMTHYITELLIPVRLPIDEPHL